ncbi:MAG: ABC transporter permease [Verrucomicrobiia bacterium]|jgi:ABC-2 type transport system permease protein
MNLRRLWAIARKEFIHILRDPRSLGLAIAIPMLLLVMFGYALTLDVDHVPLVIWDQDETPVSRELISRFLGSRYFGLFAYAQDYREVERAIDTRDALVALVVPRGFGGQIDAGRTGPAQLIVDGSDANTATLAAGYADAVAQTYSQDVTLRVARRLGSSGLAPPLDVRPRVWFNTDMESKNFIVPGLIAIIMMVITALLTSLTVAREWERGTMEQLISTPIKGPELIFGKLLPYFVIGMFNVTLAVLMGEFLFHVPLRGSIPLLFGMSAIFLLGVLSLGVFISVVAKNQLMANQLAMLSTFLPTFLLSGFIYAIANMPKPIQVITYVIPARYFIALLRGIYLKGVGLKVMMVDAVFLTVFGVLMVVLATLKFKKKLV